MQIFHMIIDHFQTTLGGTLLLKVLEATINIGCFEPIGVLCISGTQYIF